jgi:predicted helicase
MSSNFNKALEKIRAQSSNTVEQGFAFEKLSKIYFENDDIQKQQFNRVWHYKDWAKENPNFSKTDIGIDLVGELKDNKGLAAIQCKFFKSEYQITKEDLDSFVSASSSEIFSRLILIDTSNEDLGTNARSMVDNLNKVYQRIQKYDLENSRIDWLVYIENDKVTLSNKKEPRDHQIKAIDAAKKYYSSNNRGKMIMACGTGKTYTSLKIAEAIVNKKFILYMVPSLALMSQSIREWKNDCNEDFIAFSACSDKKVGRVKSDSDLIQVRLNELSIPATTDSEKLADEISKVEKNKMIVVFSTYQSIDVITDSQKKFKMNPFDLIICDEAHRTTGATFEDQEESYFVKIHEDKYVEGKKRLYMTATPRIFGNKAKKKADEGRVELASMDDLEKYGKEFFNRGFNWAVENNLLSDYKVVILAIDEGMVSSNLQKSLEDGSELKLTDATKIIGVYKALAKVGFDKKENEKLKPIKKALAFTQSIEISKIFEKEFNKVINEYIKNEKIKDENKVDLNVQVQHIDGTFNADQRTNNLNWLKDEDTEKNTCRILSNVKCLSEGIDVPSLDAIMFLHPKKSQIDVVQAVGRVMRKAEGKDLGYVIIPVTVAPGVAAEKALNDNEKYKVVWQIVNALRTHDERLDSKVNLLGLGEDVSDKIEVITMSAEQDATTAKVEDVNKKKSKKDREEDVVINVDETVEKNDEDTISTEEQMSFELDDLSQAIKAKIVQKCGTRDYWENWASDIASIAKQHINNLNSILVKKNSKEFKIFYDYLEELRDDLNPEISENDAIEMLSQHIITKPIFNILFSGSEFVKENPISKALENVVEKIYPNSNIQDTHKLENFYKSVERRAKDILSAKSKTTLINELYERFFKNAFPLTTQKLGIVYTPVELVNFMINSTEYLLKSRFNKSLGDKNVDILDPFTGTGTFITQIINSNIIPKENLKYKFKNELHANEIVLLAYYIAGINIETVYQSIQQENQYVSFDGSVLTDTFQLYEQERDMIANLLPDNSLKRTKQKKRKLKVIVGNPPYSIGQKSENDNAANISYPNLDNKITETYGKLSSATRKVGLFDNYVRSFRWATDRLEDNGIISFVTNSGWLEKRFGDGIRKSFEKDFSEIFIINLRGDVRKDMLNKQNKVEGENIFGQGSMTGISIVFLIKNTKNNDNAQIFYHDIGKNLKKKLKLKKLIYLDSIENLINQSKFKKINPDEDANWLNIGNKLFKKFIPIGIKKSEDKQLKIFDNFTNGVVTNRDSWCYNFSKKKLKSNIKNMIDNFNSEIDRSGNKKFSNNEKLKEFINKDPTKISWTRNLIKYFEKKQKIKEDNKAIREAYYRPFQKTYLYYDKYLNEVHYKTSSIFSSSNKDNNPVIVLSGVGARTGFSCFAINRIPDLNFFDGGAQCFPLYNNNQNSNLGGLFAKHKEKTKIKSNINLDFKNELSNKYNQKISDENFFYYIYGILNSPDYLARFGQNIFYELPRIPILKNYDNFLDHSKIGQKLLNLHINYEQAKKFDCKINIKKNYNEKLLYKLEKMKFSKKDNKVDKTKIYYNQFITIENIPKEAFDYIIGGKSLIEWIIDRYQNKTDKNSLINDDINDFTNETLSNPSYPLDLIQKIITVSLETQKILKGSPKLDI